MTGTQLTSDEVHTWSGTLDVPPDTRAGLYAILAADEQDRSARFRFERDRNRFIVARGVLREILGLYLGTHPGHVRFVYNALGKPALSPEFGNGLKFNLSHSGDLGLIAVAAEADVGVDLEHIRAQPDYADIARRFLSAAEVEYLNGLPGHLRTNAFFGCWTKKEAYIKARGEGLAALDGASKEPAPPGHWSLYTLHPGPGYVGALAVAGSGWRLTQARWRTERWATQSH